MKDKAFVSFLAISAILLAALLLLAWQARRSGYQNLLLAVPNGMNSRGQSPERIEELSDDEFLVTYELPRGGTAEAANSRHTVTIVGTNSAYLHVTGYRLVGGGFFTKSIWDAKEKCATLNVTAAFEIFGSTNITGRTLRIGNDIWLVTGVVDDGREDSMLYAPSSVMGGEIGAVLAMMHETSGGEAYAINVLNVAGVRDADYDFVNLSRVASAFGERFLVAWLTGLCLAILCAGKRGFLRVRQTYFSCKDELQQLYPRELFVRCKADITKAGVTILLLLAGLVAAMYAMLRILATCLAWQDLSLPERYAAADFAHLTAWLYDYQAMSIGLFTAFLVAAAATAVFGWKRAGLK